MLYFEWNGYKFKVIHYGKGLFKENMVGHRHSLNSYELHYILDGKGTLNTEDSSYPLSKGDFYVTGPDIYHQQDTDRDTPFTEAYIYLQSCGQKTNDTLVSTFLSKHFYFCKNKELAYYFERIAKEQEEKRPGYECMSSNLISILLTEITRLYLPDFINTSENNDNLYDKRFFIIETEFINNAKTVTLSKLADAIGVCERQTQRLLKKYYGKSFTEKKRESIIRSST